MPLDSSQAEFCRKLVANFYARVPADPVLSRVYPKHLQCAIESLTLFLIETLGGPEEYSLRRPFPSLRETHDRFGLGAPEREAWLRNMNAALLELDGPPELRDFFEQVAAYLTGEQSGDPVPLWVGQHAMEQAIAAARAGDSAGAIQVADSPVIRDHVRRHPAAWGVLLAFFGNSQNRELTAYARNKLTDNPILAKGMLLHAIREASLIELLLQQGADPNALDHLGHPPLYLATRAEAARALVKGGADVNARSGIQEVTALHVAARHGNIPVAAALLDCGADPSLRDKSGATPLRRAINVRKHEMAALLRSRGAPM